MNGRAWLRNVPLFAGIGARGLQRIEAIGRRRRYAAGEMIFDSATVGDCLYVVIAGRVKIFAAAKERRKTLAYLEPGEFFGEMALLDDEPRSAASLALEESELLVIAKKDFRALLVRHPRISLKIMETLSRRLRAADREIESLAFDDVLGRVAAALVDLSRNYGENVRDGRRIRMPLCQRDIAEIAGTGREVVSRVLNRFKRLECITYNDQYLTVRDEEKLKKWMQ